VRLKLATGRGAWGVKVYVLDRIGPDINGVAEE
jgi:hypothetical protein